MKDELLNIPILILSGWPLLAVFRQKKGSLRKVKHMKAWNLQQTSIKHLGVPLQGYKMRSWWWSSGLHSYKRWCCPCRIWRYTVMPGNFRVTLLEWNTYSALHSLVISWESNLFIDHMMTFITQWANLCLDRLRPYFFEPWEMTEWYTVHCVKWMKSCLVWRHSVESVNKPLHLSF